MNVSLKPSRGCSASVSRNSKRFLEHGQIGQALLERFAEPQDTRRLMPLNAVRNAEVRPVYCLRGEDPDEAFDRCCFCCRCV